MRNERKVEAIWEIRVLNKVVNSLISSQPVNILSLLYSEHLLGINYLWPACRIRTGIPAIPQYINTINTAKMVPVWNIGRFDSANGFRCIQYLLTYLIACTFMSFWFNSWVIWYVFDNTNWLKSIKLTFLNKIHLIIFSIPVMSIPLYRQKGIRTP